MTTFQIQQMRHAIPQIDSHVVPLFASIAVCPLEVQRGKMWTQNATLTLTCIYRR